MSRLKEIVSGVLALEPSAAAVEYRGRWVSWGEISRQMTDLQKLLDEAGLGASSRVGALLRNDVSMMPVILSVITSERCIVTLNPFMPDEKLAADIRGLQPPVLVASSQDWSRPDVRAAAETIGCVGIEITDEAAPAVRLVEGLERALGEDLRRAAPGVSIEMLTSGTTGAPKRVPLKASSFERMILETARYESSRGHDTRPQLRDSVQVLNTPFTHIGGIMSVFTVMAGGRKACLLERFTVEAFVDAVRRHRPKAAGAPPSALKMILDADVPKEALASLMVFRTATAPLDPDLADAFTSKYGIPVLQNYGATEFAGGVAGWTLPEWRQHGQAKRGSVGRVHAGVDARVVDAQSGAPLAAGAEGLLELRAPHLGDGAWVRTTDLAVLDDDRFLWIKGRADNAIIRGGFKVMPDDVIRALEQHPAIREAAVVALPDARLGQVPAAAFIVKSSAPAPTEQELRNFLRERLLPYQIPVVLMRVSELPRTPVMKVSQPELKRLFEEKAP